MAKYLGRIILLGGQIIARTVVKTLRDEMAAFQAASKENKRAQQARKNDPERKTGLGITLKEAKEILGVNDINDLEVVSKKFEHLFYVNSKERGGSFYLQSKIYRAKERIDHEIQVNKTKSKETAETT